MSEENIRSGNNTSQTERVNLDKNKYIYVPIIAIERKKSDDLANSIMGKSNTPGFARYKDQKLRMKQFQRLTGCRLMLIVEEFYKYCGQQRVAHLPEQSFNSAVLHTCIRDEIYVHHTVNFFDTIRAIEKTCKCIVENELSNPFFMHMYKHVRAKINTNSIVSSEQDPEKHELQISEAAEEITRTRDVIDAIVPLRNMTTNHSQIVSIRKKDNVDPTLCFQMMLMSIRGVSEKMAKAVIRMYPSMPALIKAYNECSKNVISSTVNIESIKQNTSS